MLKKKLSPDMILDDGHTHTRTDGRTDRPVHILSSAESKNVEKKTKCQAPLTIGKKKKKKKC